MSWRAVDPSPWRGWIRWAPRTWPAPERPCVDLASARLAWPAEPGAAARGAPEVAPPDPDVTYVPPLVSGAEREAILARLVAGGSTVLSHRLEAGAGGETVGETWSDPLAAWLDGVPAREWCAAWRGRDALHVALPLVAGVTPANGELDVWLAALTDLAPRAVLAIRVELEPADRRRLVARLGDGAFDAVFHGLPAGESEVARRAAARGLATLPRRPALGGLAPRAARNRELAAALWEAGELALRLKEPEAECVGYFAAARHLEKSSLDVAAVDREGNLEVLEWLAAPAREVVAEVLGGGSRSRLARLRRRWRGDEP